MKLSTMFTIGSLWIASVWLQWCDNAQPIPDKNFKDKIEQALKCAVHPVTEDGRKVENLEIYTRQVNWSEAFPNIISNSIIKLETGEVAFCRDGIKSSICISELPDDGVYDGIPDGNAFHILNNWQEVPTLNDGITVYKDGVIAMAEACLNDMPNQVPSK